MAGRRASGYRNRTQPVLHPREALMTSQHLARAGLLLLASGLGLATLPAAPTPPGVTTGTIKDRKSFFPHHKYQPLPGSAIGVLVSDVGPFMASEGRSSRADALGFSAGGYSYRWVYVPDNTSPAIRNLTIKLGKKGERSKAYPALSMATPGAVRAWGI